MFTNRATKKSNFRNGTLIVPDEIALVMPRLSGGSVPC